MNVAVVGLGKMGSALARHLLAQGLDVTVWNRHPEAAEALAGAGATPVGKLGEIWGKAQLAMSFLADDQAVGDVYLASGGLVETAPGGAVLVEMSTVSPAVSQTVADAAEERGLRYVRCPVSGNPAVLSSGNLTLIASGSPASLEAAMPVLERVGSKVYQVGAAEEARVVKLAVNSMLVASAQMLAELITMCEAWGIDRSVLLDVLAGSAIGSPFVKYKTAALLAREYDATFTTAMAVKDLRLAQAVAAAEAVPLPVTALVTDLAVATCEDGFADLDFLALLPHLQRLAGRGTDVAPGAGVVPGAG